MPFWSKKDKDKNGDESKPKVNYKARLEHKQYLVSLPFDIIINNILN